MLTFPINHFSQDATAPAVGTVPNLYHLRDELSGGTNAGSSTINVWNHRDINTEVVNEIAGASLASNQITLPAGTYKIHAHATAYSTGNHRLRLRDSGDTTTYALGSRTHTSSSDASMYTCEMDGIFTIGSATTFEVQQWFSESNAGNGWGRGDNIGVNNVFLDVYIWER